jgi:putative ABC transport system permease protein
VWPGQDPLGKRVKQGFPESPNEWREVVGVVADMKFDGIVPEVAMQVYMPYAQRVTSDFALLVRTAGDPRALATAVRDAVASADPDVPVAGLGPMDVVLQESIARQRMARLVLGVFAAVALALASIGLFGLVAHGVTERRHEIGVRMALGATRGRIVRLLVSAGVATAVAGAVVGLGLALTLTKALTSLLFGIEPFDPVTFGAAIPALLMVATLACAIPAYRATRVGITTALRAE